MSQVKEAGFIKITELSRQAKIKEQELAVAQTGFKYAGVDSLGAKVDGFVPYETMEESRLRLEKAGITITTIEARSSIKRKKKGLPSSIEMAQLAEQLGEQLEIGLSPSAICDMLARTQPNVTLQHALVSASEMISKGVYVYAAFDAQKTEKGESVFPETFIYALRIGQEVGALTDPDSDKSVGAAFLMLKFFAESQKRAHEIKRKIKSALTYPIAVGVACFIAFLIEVYVIMPMMKPLFEGLLQGKDDKLPLLTQIMLDIGDFMSSLLGLLCMALFIAGMVYLFYFLFKDPKGIDWRERISLRIPVFGAFYRNYHSSQACRNLAMLWEGEQDVKKRFQTARDTSTNPEYKEMFANILNVLSNNPVDMPQTFVPYYKLLGEEFASVVETIQLTGNGQSQFYSYAKILEQRANEQLEATIAVLQQVSIIVPAIFVVFILIASYMPMFELVGKLAAPK